ncbi:natural killer cell receptor 2B4 isoform X1 [Alosa alosa]|uniref:natural killer cell receptor 2B4 isoform X1 n=1 Tax=Alosa alosa TaxID=278164 RepID=UPI0020152EAE|nr:natural killer cell receptor 2B4 isoform X1 [Alosa alosa]
MATSECIMASLLIFTSVAQVSAGDIFGIRGGSISLSPEQVTKDKTVMSIIWKHNKDKVAEWLKGDEGITVFRIFNCSATVDNQTWVLTISNLQPHFNGTYSVEINDKENDLRMQLTVLDPVKEPNITTDCNSTSCTLTCEGEDSSEHTQFSWTDRKGNRNSGNMWTVEKRSEVYICNFSNPVSWAIRSFSLTDDFPLGIIAGIVVAIVGGIAVILIVLRIHRCRKNRTGMYTPATADLSRKVADPSSIMNGHVVVNVQNGSAPQETPNLTEGKICTVSQ